MGTETQTQAKDPRVGLIAPAPTSVLQRACACGQHAVASGGDCEACRRTAGEEPIREKLAVSQPGDVHEQEADRVAEAVLRLPDTAGRRYAPSLSLRTASEPDGPARRRADEQRDEDEDEPIRATAAPGGRPAITPEDGARLDALHGGGEPLPASVRAFFEPRFGHDLAGVRVHADPEAGRLAETLHAHAFARGQHVVFAPGRYQPDTPAGRRLLAHELTHTLQQRQGAVSPVADTVQRRAAPSIAGTAMSLQAPEAAGPDLIDPSPAADTEPDAGPPPAPEAAPPPVAGGQAPATPPAAGAAAAGEAGAPPATGAGAAGPPPTAPATEGDGGAALPEQVTLDTSSESGLLQSLGTVPVSSFGQSMTQAEQAVGELHSQERTELAGSLPEIDRPTGLPRLSERPVLAATVVETGRVPEAELPGPRERPPPDTSHQAARGPLPAAQVETRVEEPADEGDGSWWDWLWGAVRGFLRKIPTTDPTLDTSAGERPRVDTTGDASPNENRRQQVDSDREVATRQVEADEATRADFGEHDVYPDAPQERMRPRSAPGGPPGGSGAGVREPGAVPNAVRSGLDQAGAGWLRGEVDQRADQERQDREAYERDSDQARAENQRQIDDETARIRAQQEDSQLGVRREVSDQRERWREDNRRVRETYGSKATAERQQTDGQIDAKVRSTEQQADDELSRAEREAKEKRKETETKAEAKKREAENRPRSTWDRIKGAVSDFFDAIRDAVNALFDELRRFVRGLIERAKQVVRGWIEAARQAIVGLIRAFGEFLKVVVSIALAAFPEAAKRARRWIDDRVDKAVEVVNEAADALQEFAQRALDALGAALDFVLSVYQRAYLLLIEGLRLLAVGLIEIMERIGHLVEAAGQMPDHFIGQVTEELLGRDLTQPLPFERTAAPSPAAVVSAAVATGEIAGPDARALTRSAVGDADVTVDRVAPLELDTEFFAALDLQEGEEREFGEVSDPSRTIAAVQQEQTGGGEAAAGPTPTTAEPTTPTTAEPTTPVPEAAPLSPEQEVEQRLEQMLQAEPEPPCPKEASGEKADQSAVPEETKFGPLTIGQRARYLTGQMIKGVKNWFSCNWPWLLAAAIGVLTVLVIAEILTGGAITAAIPPLMQLIAMIMLGVAAVRVAAYIGEYLAKGWEGDRPGAARSLARGLAVGAIELIFTLLFDLNAVIKAARQGLTATLRGAAATARQAGAQVLRSARRVGGAAVQTVRAPGRAAALVGRVTVRRGRMVFQGLRGGFAKGVRSLDDLARRLWNTVRFRRFKLVRRGSRIQLYGYINPWILLADGTVVEVFEHEVPAGTRLGEAITIPGARPTDAPRPGVLIGEIPHRPADIRQIAETASSKVLTPGARFIEHFEDHRRLFERAFGESFPATSAGADQFLARLTDLIHSGEFRAVGLATLKKGEPLSYIFRGRGLTLVMKPSGEWVTLLRSGEGLDLAIEKFFQLRF
jgi:hypothetical protein